MRKVVNNLHYFYISILIHKKLSCIIKNEALFSVRFGSFIFKYSLIFAWLPNWNVFCLRSSFLCSKIHIENVILNPSQNHDHFGILKLCLWMQTNRQYRLDFNEHIVHLCFISSESKWQEHYAWHFKLKVRLVDDSKFSSCYFHSYD